MTNAEYEMQEVRRAFEKFGISDLLISADGSISPHVGVLRLLHYLSDNDLMLDIHLTLIKRNK
jgi:hypothetical protein